MFSGSIVALATPMAADESVDWACLERLLDWHVEQGTNAVVAVGTTGESATLTVNEHCKVIQFVVEKIAGRIPVIAGTGANSTSEAIELTREAANAGADACLLVTPYYNKPTQQGLYLHHKKIAEAVDIKQILYNVPGRTACDMLPETVERLAGIENIVAVKEATGDISRGREIRQRCGDSITLLSGDDGTFLDLMAEGASGNISVTANIAPSIMSQVCQLALDGELDQARLLNQKLGLLHQRLFVEANPIPVKWCMAQMGLCGPAIRLPLTPLSEEFHASLQEALEMAGLS